MIRRTPSAGADLLYGVRAIADFLGIRPRQALYLIEARRVPHWREGRAILARRSSLNEWAAEREAAARASASAA